MQPLLKDLLSNFHKNYTKSIGFKKVRQKLHRIHDGVYQEINFQSSSWNSSDEPICFYINLRISFLDIEFPEDTGTKIMGDGRIEGIAKEAPRQYELTNKTYDSVLHQLHRYIPLALEELPKHYEDVRKRALKGYGTPIPLPDTWKEN